MKTSVMFWVIVFGLNIFSTASRNASAAAMICGMKAENAIAIVMKTARKNQSFQRLKILYFTRSRRRAVPISIARTIQMYEVDCSISGLSMLYGKSFVTISFFSSLVAGSINSLTSRYSFVIANPVIWVTKKMSSINMVILTVCFINSDALHAYINICNR